MFLILKLMNYIPRKTTFLCTTHLKNIQINEDNESTIESNWKWEMQTRV